MIKIHWLKSQRQTPNGTKLNSNATATIQGYVTFLKSDLTKNTKRSVVNMLIAVPNKKEKKNEDHAEKRTHFRASHHTINGQISHGWASSNNRLLILLNNN